MRIGELSNETGCSVETIRYYERAGILPEPLRAANNYRHYGPAHGRRLRFVRRLRDLGFSLEEVRALLGMIDGGRYACADVETMARDHLADIRRKIADLQNLESSLNELVSSCRGGETPDCSFLEALFDRQAGERTRAADHADRRPGKQ